MLCCRIFRSFDSCSTSRVCLCAGLEKNVSHRRKFLHTSGKRIPSTKLCPKRIRTNNHHTAHRSRIERFDIVEPHVTLACVPGLGWVVQCEDCLAHRTPLRSEGDRCVSKVELQIKGQPVCTRAFCSRSNVHPKKIESCPSSLPP